VKNIQVDFIKQVVWRLDNDGGRPQFFVRTGKILKYFSGTVRKNLLVLGLQGR